MNEMTPKEAVELLDSAIRTLRHVETNGPNGVPAYGCLAKSLAGATAARDALYAAARRDAEEV